MFRSHSARFTLAFYDMSGPLLLCRLLYLVLTSSHLLLPSPVFVINCHQLYCLNRCLSVYWTLIFLASGYLPFSSKRRSMLSPLLVAILYHLNRGLLVEVWIDFKIVSWSSYPHTRGIQQQSGSTLLPNTFLWYYSTVVIIQQFFIPFFFSFFGIWDVFFPQCCQF